MTPTHPEGPWALPVTPPAPETPQDPPVSPECPPGPPHLHGTPKTRPSSPPDASPSLIISLRRSPRLLPVPQEPPPRAPQEPSKMLRAPHRTPRVPPQGPPTGTPRSPLTSPGLIPAGIGPSSIVAKILGTGGAPKATRAAIAAEGPTRGGGIGQSRSQGLPRRSGSGQSVPRNHGDRPRRERK